MKYFKQIGCAPTNVQPKQADGKKTIQAHVGNTPKGSYVIYQ